MLYLLSPPKRLRRESSDALLLLLVETKEMPADFWDLNQRKKFKTKGTEGATGTYTGQLEIFVH